MATWLAACNWVFETTGRRSDIPSVDRAYYLARMSGQETPNGERRTKPNLAVFGNIGG